jgi:hypothetical protein
MSNSSSSTPRARRSATSASTFWQKKVTWVCPGGPTLGDEHAEVSPIGTPEGQHVLALDDQRQAEDVDIEGTRPGEVADRQGRRDPAIGQQRDHLRNQGVSAKGHSQI